MLMFPSALQAIPNQEGHEAGALVFVGRGVQEDTIWELFGILRLAFHFRRAFASSKEAEVKFGTNERAMSSRARDKSKKFEEAITCFCMFFL